MNAEFHVSPLVSTQISSSVLSMGDSVDLGAVPSMKAKRKKCVPNQELDSALLIGTF
jgi:hypothetical protein